MLRLYPNGCVVVVVVVFPTDLCVLRSAGQSPPAGLPGLSLCAVPPAVLKRPQNRRGGTTFKCCIHYTCMHYDCYDHLLLQLETKMLASKKIFGEKGAITNEQGS